MMIGQNELIPTEKIKIHGEVIQNVQVNTSTIQTMEKKEIGDITITNHKGEIRQTLKDLEGVQLKTILQQVTLQEENPKYFSEFYFTCTSSDGYSVVFSWNEFFNHQSGEHIYIITSVGGKNAIDHEHSLMLISTDDIQTGRRFLKCLSEIMVSRI